jgi:Na+/H+ antiporter NhaD/arsenite permease-like protein
VTIRLVILVVTYLLIAVRRVPLLRLNRPAAALLGAVGMVTIGGLPMREAYAAIDLDVVIFLLGVLLITGYLEAGGFFEWAARHIVDRARSATALLGAVVLASGLLSAFFVNDTICLVLTPLVIAALRPLGRRPQAIHTPDAPFDRPLVIRSLLVFGGALAGWLAGFSLPLVAITAATILLVIAQRDPAEAFAKVEWSLLLFFGALFVVMRGARDLPLVAWLTSAAGTALTGAPVHDAVVTSAAMVALSNIVSNVPAVILWLPVVPKVAAPSFTWLAMAMSSTFAGNLTLLGSMANLIVAERAEARGEHIGFVDYLRVGAPVALLTIAWGIATLALVAP